MTIQDLRVVRRLVYDRNYQRALEILCDTMEQQDKQIKSLESRLKEVESVYKDL